MTNQHTTSQQIKPILRIALAGLALIILSQGLGLPARHVLDFLTVVVRHTVVLLPSFALTASQALQPAAFGQQHFHVCALEMLVSLPLLGAAARIE